MMGVLGSPSHDRGRMAIRPGHHGQILGKPVVRIGVADAGGVLSGPALLVP
jgi:hypothetical protein